MATVFISHSSRDDSLAKQLADDLRLIGHTPWIDDIEVWPGESIISSVQDGISKSRHAIVLFIARGSTIWLGRRGVEGEVLGCAR